MLMNNRVTLCENALDPASWTTHECDDIRQFLVGHFGEWPKTARIYLNRVGKDTDITPYDDAGVERLGDLGGHFFVVVYPAEVATVLLIISIALSAAGLLIGYLLRPSLPSNQQDQSSTNSLGDRQNRERINQRIPDIYGKLWVTPDLISVPYRIFIGNKEVEYMYMAIGRGHYDILDVRDDVTPLEQVDGAGCEIYGPDSSPNSGDEPQVSIGEPINTPVMNLKKYSSINGQTLNAPNANKFKADNNIRFTEDGIVESLGDIDFTDYFSAGTEANPKYLIIGNSDYDGTYSILDVDSTQIVLSDPASVNAAWNAISGETDYSSPSLVNSGDNWEGPFLILDNTVTELRCNFVSTAGLYKQDSKGNQYAVAVTVQIEVTSIDNDGNEQGSPIYFQSTLKGSDVFRKLVGVTLIAHLPIAGSCKVRARRISNTDLRDGWFVTDQVQWRDLYAASPLIQTDFGNVTTIQTVTWPTPQALALKQRKINVLVERKTGTSPDSSLINAADIICSMALDPYIGRRTELEIDRDGIQAVLGPAGEVEQYFGTSLCTEFSYAFDDSKMSFEEMVTQVCQAVFCEAYRRGNVLSVMFEKATENSVMLFNHRNKIPGSETRNVSFGPASENDGIDLEYVEPNAPNAQNIDSSYILHFPEDGSAVAPKKITAVGVRNRVQAWILGWRLYNKLLFQNTAVEFTATSEAATRVIGDRILVADNTRPDIQDGEVLEQNGLELTLSQPVVFSDMSPAPNYTIFLQHYDDTVESIPISPGTADNKIILTDAPSTALVLDPAKFARTAYMIVADTDQQSAAFLLQEKPPKDGGLWDIKAINYNERYYEHDQDYNSSPRIIDQIIPGDGAGAGYAAQASSSVYVSGKAMPWIAADNASYPFGITGGKPPVAVPIQAAETDVVAIAANGPGEPVGIFENTVFSETPYNTEGPSNTVNPDTNDGGFGWHDAEGDPDYITAQTLASGDGWSDKRYPTYYATSPALGIGGLIAAWAKKDTPSAGKYQVVEVFVVGFGGNFMVPAGGVDTLLLGINDAKHSDNGGGFQVLITQTGAAAGGAAAENPIPDVTTTDPNSLQAAIEALANASNSVAALIGGTYNITSVGSFQTFDLSSEIPDGYASILVQLVIYLVGTSEQVDLRAESGGVTLSYQSTPGVIMSTQVMLSTSAAKSIQAQKTNSGSTAAFTVLSCHK